MTERNRTTAATGQQRPHRLLAVTVGLLCGAALLWLGPPVWARPGEAPTEAPPIRLPQMRIDRVDAQDFPKIRVFATILDAKGHPVEVKAIKKLEVLDGKRRSADPFAEFENGAALGGREDAVMWPADKAKVKHSAVVVVAGHQHESLRGGSLGQRLKEALQGLFKGFGKADRVNVIFYGDRLYSFVQLKGRTSELSDIEFMRTAKVNCGHARDEAIAGGPITLGDNDKTFAAGDDLCGLSGDTKTLFKRVQQRAYEGFFPRLFNLGMPFFNPKRYCSPPKQSLKIWGEFTPANSDRQLAQWNETEEKGLPQEWVTSAFDEALRMILRDGRADEEKSIILVSDGIDGYFKELDLCRAHPPAVCEAMQGKNKRDACVRDELKNRLIKRQAEFKKKALHWIGMARAAGVRVFAVGLGMLGEPYELERLRLLAERTGGTYREALTEGQVGGQTQQMATELLSQLVIDFVHQTPDEVVDELSVKLKVRLDKTMVAGSTSLQSRAYTLAIPARLGWRDQAKDAVIEVLVSLQEALGYKWYVILGITVIVIFSILFLLISFFITRGIFRFFARRFGKQEPA